MTDGSTYVSALDSAPVGIPGHADVGQVIAGYRVEERAGAGGMGVVYRASEPGLGRRVALKLIAPEYAADPRFRELLLEESRKAAALEHPNVIPIYRSGEEDGQLFIAMRYVDGASLEDLVEEQGRLPVGRAVRIVSRVADALDAAHAAGLVHRDVKPANILIADPDGEEQVYLSDFGLSVRAADGQPMGGRLVGTLGYLPPEQIQGSPIDGRADVYSLGCVLFRALTGRVPFPGATTEAKIHAHLTEAPPRVTALVPELPRRLDDVIAKALAKRPEDRFATAGELAAAARDARSDVLLCHHPDDAAMAAVVAERLGAAGLETHQAGADVAGEMLAAHACYVLVGHAGLGEWAREALEAASRVVRADRGFVLASVLLPGAPDPFDPGLSFLADRPLVDLSASLEDVHAADDLLRPLGALPRLRAAATAGDVCPYRGLQPFTEEDADLFFGRDQDVARLVAKLRRTRFLAVLGASGSGKSSVVRAGLVPALRGDDSTLRIVTLTPGDAPLKALAAALGDGAPSAEEMLRDEGALLRGEAPGGRLLIVVDQFEEVFSLTADARERRAFIDNLIHAATMPGASVTVVAAMRSDFYPRAAEHSALRALIAAQQYLVGPLDREGLRQAIEEPARRVGLELEPGLTRRIMADVSDRPGSLPLLEHLLLELWHRRRGRLLTLEAYAAAGGVEGALARRANMVYAGLSDAERTIARRVLLRLTQPGEGTEDTRRRARLAELATDEQQAPEVERVVGAMVEARLLTLDTDAAGTPTVEVAHEALIRGWPELRGWIDGDREALRLHRRLTDVAADWDAGGRDDGPLYRGAQLAIWEGRPEDDLNPLERAFLDASRRLAGREIAARRRRVRYTIGGLAVALAAVGTGGIFALVQRNNAQDSRATALSRQIALSSTATLPRDPELAVLLADRAYDVKPTVEAEQALRQAVHNSQVRGALRLPDLLPIAVADAGGGRVLVGSESGTLHLWNERRDPRGASAPLVGTWGGGIGAMAAVRGGTISVGTDGKIVLWPGLPRPGKPRVVAGVTEALWSVAAASDGRRVLVAGDGGVWDVDIASGRLTRIASGVFYSAIYDRSGGGYLASTGDGAVKRWVPGAAQPQTLPLTGYAINLAQTPDQRLLAVATTDGGVTVFRLLPRPVRVHFEPMTGGANGVAYSPDGRSLAAAGGDGSVLLLTTEGRTRVRLVGHEAGVYDLRFAGNDRVLSIGRDHSVRSWAWSANLGHELRSRPLAEKGGVAFQPDGRVTLVQADGSSTVWDPAQGTVRAGLPAVGRITSAGVTPDGRFVAVSLHSGRVVVRDASGTTLFSRRVEDIPYKVAYDPRSRRVAVALEGGAAVLMSVSQRGAPTVIARHPTAAHAVAFSPTDPGIASGGKDNKVSYSQAGGASRPVGEHEGPVMALAFSADGRLLASASSDKTVRVWNLGDPEGNRVLRGHDGQVLDAAFTANGRLLVSAGDDGVKVWDWRRRVNLVTFPRATGALWVDVRGRAPEIVEYGQAGRVRIETCDVCGAIESVRALARARTTRDLTARERVDFQVNG